MRMTQQRKAILETMRKLKTHPTADELYRMLKKSHPKISLATVYRNLEVLSQEGFIRRLELGGSNQRRYDGNPSPHWHVHCQNCGKVGDVWMEEDIDILSRVKSSEDFDLYKVNLEFWGLCPQCKEKLHKQEGKEEAKWPRNR